MMTRRLTIAIGVAAAFLGMAATLRFSEARAIIDGDTARRILQVTIGLGLAAYANLMPKRIGQFKGSAEAERRTQKILRVGGWSMTLAGLIFAGLWAFAPLNIADPVSMIVVIAALVVILGYAGWGFMACRSASASQSR